MTNLYREAKYLAEEALSIADGDFEQARDELHLVCDSHECSIYYGKGIEFCANNNTSNGEDWIEDCGGICQEDDTFGSIACRIAFATLYVEGLEILNEMESKE